MVLAKAALIERFQTGQFLFPALWAAAVPWLLFPTIAPVLTAVSLILLLFLLFTNRSTPRFSLPATTINGYLLVTLILTGIAYLVSPLPQISLPKLTVTLLGLITFFLILPRLNQTSEIERLITILALCAGFMVLAGFFSLEWPERQIINLQPITNRLPHLSGSFSINYNEMAGTLLMLLPFSLAAFRGQIGRSNKLIFLLILIASAIMLFFTQSRSGILGLFFISLTWRFWGRIPLRRIIPALLILALLLILIFILMGYSPSDLLDWLSRLDASSKQGDVPATSWLTRLDIWRVGRQLLNDYPVIGSGLYTFDPVSRANYIYETILPTFNLTHAHNLLLQTGASLGLIGIVAIVGIWTAVLASLWQTGRSDDEKIRRLSAVFAASAAGYLFFNLFDTITFGQKPGVFIWVILAGSISLSRLAVKRSTASHSPPRQRYQWAGQKLALYGPLLILIILLLSPALPRNLANLQLDKARLQSKSDLTLSAADFPEDARRAGLAEYLAGNREKALSIWRTDPQSTDYLQSQGTIALLSGNLSRSITWYDLALDITPDSAVTYFWRGIANEERGTQAIAEADFRRASEFAEVSEVSLSTTAVIQYRIGLLLARKEDWPGAADAFARAAALQPQISTYYEELGDALTALGDQTGASNAYQKAEGAVEE